jgi:hypothetical protein|tara:strand:+ start:114 stop:248 length:135 start_codon:yes stop_codon:yes gene_type:complete
MARIPSLVVAWLVLAAGGGGASYSLPRIANGIHNRGAGFSAERY